MSEEMGLSSSIALRHLKERGHEKGATMTADPEQKCCVTKGSMLCMLHVMQWNAV